MAIKIKLGRNQNQEQLGLVSACRLPWSVHLTDVSVARAMGLWLCVACGYLMSLIFTFEIHK